MSHDPQHHDADSPPAHSEPTGASAQPSQPMPPMDPAVVQAGWRYSARSKNQGLAWGLWAGSALIGMIPLHAFYLGRIKQGILRTALLIGPLALVFISYFAIFVWAFKASDDADAPPPAVFVPIFASWGLLLLAGLVAFIWWLVDAAKMNQSLEAADEKVRREIAAEHGVDPWSF